MYTQEEKLYLIHIVITSSRSTRTRHWERKRKCSRKRNRNGP